MKTIKYKGAVYVIAAWSSEPLERALQRIQELKDSGRDAHAGTIKRLKATTDPGKIMGIALAAKKMKWEDIAKMAANKYKDITGTNIPKT